MRAIKAYRSILLLAVVFSALAGQKGAFAAEEINVSKAGVAIHGYDPVAYHRENTPVEGKQAFSAQHDGATYWFASAENRDAFLQAPDTYAPAYGGWCAYGVRVGRKFNTDPQAFGIVNGRLYFYLDLGTQKVWEEDVARNIAIADRIWPSIKATPARQLAE
ncbi:MAG: YHS domain-containing (seleno)protein [Rhodospirillales bacterium]